MAFSRRVERVSRPAKKKMHVADVSWQSARQAFNVGLRSSRRGDDNVSPQLLNSFHEIEAGPANQSTKKLQIWQRREHAKQQQAQREGKGTLAGRGPSPATSLKSYSKAASRGRDASCTDLRRSESANPANDYSARSLDSLPKGRGGSTLEVIVEEKTSTSKPTSLARKAPSSYTESSNHNVKSDCLDPALLQGVKGTLPDLCASYGESGPSRERQDKLVDTTRSKGRKHSRANDEVVTTQAQGSEAHDDKPRSSPKKSKSSKNSQAATPAPNRVGRPRSNSKSKAKVKKTRYECPDRQCQQTFSTSGHARRHYRVHLESRSYTCPHQDCQASFTRRDNCTQHQRSMHDMVVLSPVLAPVNESPIAEAASPS